MIISELIHELTHGQKGIFQHICIARIAMICITRFCTKHSFARLPFHHLDWTIQAAGIDCWFLFALK